MRFNRLDLIISRGTFNCISIYRISLSPLTCLYLFTLPHSLQHLHINTKSLIYPILTSLSPTLRIFCFIYRTFENQSFLGYYFKFTNLNPFLSLLISCSSFFVPLYITIYSRILQELPNLNLLKRFLAISASLPSNAPPFCPISV